MTEIVNYQRLGCCPFCEEYPTLREFNREDPYLFCANDECAIFDVRIDPRDWSKSRNKASNSRIEFRIWQKKTQILIWILSWIPLTISIVGAIFSKDYRPFIFIIPFSIVETFLTTMLIWRTK